MGRTHNVTSFPFQGSRGSRGGGGVIMRAILRSKGEGWGIVEGGEERWDRGRGACTSSSVPAGKNANGSTVSLNRAILPEISELNGADRLPRTD